MVRLLVSEGEGQHNLTRRRPGALPAQPDLVSSPWRASVAAAGLTGLLALGGRSRPGTFIRSAAFFGVADLSWTAAGLYGRQEMIRGVFKMDNIEPKPGKMWDRTTHWTTEDATLGGGALGIFMAMNPRAMPGARGFSRFLGAATVGCALGFKIGQTFLVRLPPQLLSILDSADMIVRQKDYKRLQQNHEAKASLSGFGKLALSFHTSPYLHILRAPLQNAAMAGMVGGKQHGHSQHGHQGANMTAEMDKYILVQTEFKEGELTGPDVENGYRAYSTNIQSQDASSIQDWLERLQDLKTKAGTELPYVWQYLAEREREFYKTSEEDREKDIFRRELQLLNHVAADLVVRHALLAYNENDAKKRLQQLTHTDYAATSYETPQHSAQEIRYSGPHIAAEQVRTHWSRHREMLGLFENKLREFEAVQLEEGSVVAEQLKGLRQNTEDLRKNVEATERLLRWFEQQVHEAEK